MPLKLSCPNCGHPNRVSEPYPLPGAEVMCGGCATALAVSYPPGIMDKLRAAGKTFLEDDIPAAAPKILRVPPPLSAPVPGDRTEVDPTQLGPSTGTEPNERTLPAGRDPWGQHPAGTPDVSSDFAPTTPMSPAPPPPAAPRRPGRSAPVQTPDATNPYRDRAAAAPAPAPEAASRRPDPAASAMANPPQNGASTPAKGKADKRKNKQDNKPRTWGGCLFSWGLRLGCAGVLLGGAVAIVGGAVGGYGYWYYSKDLPSVDALQEYSPPTVTEVYDHEGVLIGELYEQRRYVVELETIPEPMQQAFIAAEDASFWNHGGVDYVGLTRAVINEATGGAKRQGASTITMQVTRNFLLTRDKTYERKIKEIILAQRIESVYDKKRILWLYLNEIYLGSGAYGVEAAARIYLGKHIQDVSIAEAALIAGLAPAPSTYSPHKNWDKARERQLYVLGQMLEKKLITQAEHDAAKAEHITIVKEENPFLTTAPHFTEYVRRHIIETYGFERVYNEGLRVTTTCELDLQTTAQDAVVKQVHVVDKRVGFRREGVETLADDAAISKRRGEHEEAMIAANMFKEDPAGRSTRPPESILEQGEVYDAVILEVTKSWARVAVGKHEGIIPIAWSQWVYDPNHHRSWRFRKQADLREIVRANKDKGITKGPVLRKGDVVIVKIEALSSKTEDKELNRALRRTPAAEQDLLALRLWQRPEVEAATMSIDAHTGAVRAMVGGADFSKSEFNRAIQAKRQVGSTFKPIVYTAAIDSERLTSATIVPDVRGSSYATESGFVWKPDNYGDEYLGNITLRKALAMSKNTCTIKVLEVMDPGMNDDVLYNFARKLGIGGPPSHTLGDDWITSPDNDHLCPWTREHRDSTICMDRLPPKDPDISNTRHRMQMKPDDVYMCRSCDMSMGLGSASLTMEELVRAYSAFATGGKLIQPYYIEEVRDRHGNVLEKHEPVEPPQVIRPEVATIGTWLLENVAYYGTGAPAYQQLRIRMAGKTGTTQDFKDAWFVGYTNDVLTAAWVGFDEPRSLGLSSTGGRTALPIWVDVMREAAPKEKDRRFPIYGNIEWHNIDEAKGTRVTSGGRKYPFIHGTEPSSTGVAAGETDSSDHTEL